MKHITLILIVVTLLIPFFGQSQIFDFSAIDDIIVMDDPTDTTRVIVELIQFVDRDNSDRVDTVTTKYAPISKDTFRQEVVGYIWNTQSSLAIASREVTDEPITNQNLMKLNQALEAAVDSNYFYWSQREIDSRLAGTWRIKKDGLPAQTITVDAAGRISGGGTIFVRSSLRLEIRGYNPEVNGVELNRRPRERRFISLSGDIQLTPIQL